MSDGYTPKNQHEADREIVREAIDKIIRTLNPNSAPNQFTAHAVSINRNSRGMVRVSYRVTHFLGQD